MDLKEQILKESHQLFHQFGVKSVTMDDIARQMGISKKTLYKFFTKKDELVYTVAEKVIGHSESECIACAQKSENPIHELYLIMEILRAQFGGMNPSMVYDLQKYYRKSWLLLEEHENVFITKILEKNLKKGIELGLYRDDINIDVLAKLRIQEMKLGFDGEVFNPIELDLNVIEIQIILLEHFTLGITTLKGHELANVYHEQLKK